MKRSWLPPLGLPSLVMLLVTIVGAVVVVAGVHDPQPALSFRAYLGDLAVAWGLLGIGHGINAGTRP